MAKGGTGIEEEERRMVCLDTLRLSMTTTGTTTTTTKKTSGAMKKKTNHENKPVVNAPRKKKNKNKKKAIAPQISLLFLLSHPSLFTFYPLSLPLSLVSRLFFWVPSTAHINKHILLHTSPKSPTDNDSHIIQREAGIR